MCRRLSTLVCASALLSAALGAQETRPATRCTRLARDWPTLCAQIRSADPATSAWGAYGAGKLGVRAAIPDLVRRLDAVPGERCGEDASQLLVGALLAALIRLEARIPAEDLGAWSARWGRPQEVLILASRDPAGSLPFLLSLLRDGECEPYWWVVCNLILARDPRSLFATQLPLLSFQVEIHVVDGLPDPGCVCRCGCGTSDPEDDGALSGFPPAVVHELSGVQRAGDRLLAAGPTPAWIACTEQTPRASLPARPAPRTVDWDQRTRYLLRCCACALGQAPPDLRARETVEHVWIHAREFRTWALDLARERRAQWRQLMERMAAAGLVDRATAARSPFSFKIVDRRAVPKPRLPRLEL